MITRHYDNTPYDNTPLCSATGLYNEKNVWENTRCNVYHNNFKTV